MAEVIRMPRLSDTMEEGNIISWLKKVGDKVEVGDILAEVETDKATMDLESFNEGILLYIGKASGTVPVDEVIAIIGKKGEDVEALLNEASSAKNTSNNGTTTAEEPEKITSPKPVPSTVPSSVDTSNDDRIKASPLAKKMAKDLSIPLSQLKGSGEGGRIVKNDVIHAKNGGGPYSESAPPIPNLYGGFEYGDVQLSQMRKTIARRLSESKFTAPHFYLTVEVDMGNSISMRKAANEKNGFKISFNDIIIKACAIALKKHPKVNASWHDTHITIHEEVNIGVAVAIDDGLIVPVLKNADWKPMSVISNEVKDLAGRSKNRKLSMDEMQGNTFTISNLGMFGIDEFTAIINPPAACILAVSSIVQKPVVKDGTIAVGSVMKLTLSCDHRVVDGASGAAFINTVKAHLENPLQMLI
ncbi:MAG: dihydrolipoamide acetyltransferase family protein [Saprospiraceae bacterium]